VTRHRVGTTLGRFAVKATTHLPEGLLANPERAALNLGMMVMGGLALLPPRAEAGALGEWPRWFQIEWGVGMVLAGAAAMHGYWTGYRPTERVGAAGVAFGCILYGVQIILVGMSKGAVLVGILFILIAVSKALRLLRSLAVGEYMTRHLEDGDLGGPRDPK
jgi:hypothetical protein